MENVFEDCHSANYWTAKEETYCGIRDWYKTTHSVSPAASAADMSEIMEAYWNLSSKRFIDNCCMMTDADLLGDLPARIQDEMYEFLSDDRKLEVKINVWRLTYIFDVLLVRHYFIFVSVSCIVHLMSVFVCHDSFSFLPCTIIIIVFFCGAWYTDVFRRRSFTRC